jgi:acetyl-CoA/propionyl-CoA carboxylase, biotin carboxylase, biotin carboxyl carrier protein
MNTRLQVEHPVTEAVVTVAGEPLDLVDLQLRVAAGEPLPFGQQDVRCSGHAVEARVYAEDAFAGFLPQAGTASLVRWSPRARVDAALETGSHVGTAYDPMLGKVIASGPTREAARRSLVAALDDTAILGLTTNLGFLRALASSDAFREDRIDTAWLDRNAGELRAPDGTVALVFAAWVLAREGGAGEGPGGPFGVGDGWRLAGPPAPVSVELVVDGQPRVLSVHGSGVDGHEVRPVAAEAGVHRLEVDGLVQEATVLVEPHRVQVSHLGHTFVLDRPDAFGPSGGATVGDGGVTSPMPGTVLAVHVSTGDRVEDGQVLGVVEAMKMELALKAPFPGTVTAVGAVAGDSVALGDELFRVEER